MSNKKSSRIYIAIEGIDTCGKSTQISLLQDRYKEALFTKEPGGTKIGEELRDILLFGDEYRLSSSSEFFIFLADRAEHIDRVIVPNREKMVVSDRSLVSGIAYADIDELSRQFELEGAMRDAEDGDFVERKILEFNLFATKGIVPDLIVVLNLDRDELKRRISLKTHDKIESRGVDYLMNIQSRIIKTSKSLKALGSKVVIIDAGLSIEEISSKIEDEIKKFLKKQD